MKAAKLLLPLVLGLACARAATAGASHVSEPTVAGSVVCNGAASCDSLQVHEDSVMVLGVMMHKGVVAPVKSGSLPLTNAIDTLPTSVPGVNVVLYNDNTWHYVKTDSYLAKDKVFTEYWDTKEVNPYKMPLDSLEEVWSLWLVDSLGSYHAPTTGRVSSKFGIRNGRRHQGVDLALNVGTPLHCVFDGKVRFAGPKGGYGNLVVVRHNNGLETFYGHMSRIDVEVGAIVHAGDVLGTSGNTGHSTGPHLHFETRYMGLAMDPQRIIDFSTGYLSHRMMVLKRRYFNDASRYDQNFDDEFLLKEDDEKALAEQRRKQQEAALKAQVWYTVKNGDNLGAIARRYHTTVNNICRLNGLKNPNAIRAGKKIRVR